MTSNLFLNKDVFLENQRWQQELTVELGIKKSGKSPIEGFA